MSYKLTIKANHRTGGDMLEVLVYIADAAGQSYHPEAVESGKIEFLSGDEHSEILLGKAEITKYHGNADGAIRTFLLHPANIEDLKYRAEVKLSDGTVLTKAGPFDVIEPSKVNTTLPEQPDIRVPSSAPGRSPR